MVQCRPMPESEDWLMGLFDFRGSLLPLLDSSQLLGHGTSDVRMSSRILVLRTSEQSAENRELVGLTVEHVLGGENLNFDDDTAHQPVPSFGIDFLGPVALTSNGTVQLTLPSRLPTTKK